MKIQIILVFILGLGIIHVKSKSNEELMNKIRNAWVKAAEKGSAGDYDTVCAL